MSSFSSFVSLFHQTRCYHCFLKPSCSGFLSVLQHCNSVFSLTWPASMQIYWNKRKRLHKKKSSTPTGLVWDINMAVVSLFWDTNMAAMTSSENTQQKYQLDFFFHSSSFSVLTSSSHQPFHLLTGNHAYESC